MASTTISKTIKSNEQSNRILSNGQTSYYNFAIPKSSGNLDKIIINLPISCGAGQTIVRGPFSGSSTIGSELTISVSFDGGINYTELYNHRLSPNYNGMHTYEVTNQKNPLSCIIKINSAKNNSGVYPGTSGSWSTTYPDTTLKPANIVVYTSVSSATATADSLSPSGKTLIINQANTFTWKTTSPGTPKTQTLYYKLETESTYKSINVGSTSTSYTFSKGALPQGKYNWYVKVSDTWGYTMTSSVARFTMGSNPKVSITYPSSNGTIWRTQPLVFTWKYSDSLDLIQTRYIVEYKKTSETTWTRYKDEYNAASSVTFPANFFSYGKYNIRVSSRNSDGLWPVEDWISITFQAGSVPTVSINEPSNKATLRKNKNNVISWTLSDTLDTGQYSYQLRIRKSDSTSYIYNETVTTSASLHNILANSLDNGNYAWQLRVRNNDKNWTAWTSERTFTYGSVSTLKILGPEDGTNVRRNAPLIITWEHTDTFETGQKSWELGYKLSNESSWTTKSGTTAKSCTIASGTLEAGTYNFRLRVTNNDNSTTAWQNFSLLVGAIPFIELTYPVDANIKRDIMQIFTWSLTDALATGQKSFELGYRLTESEEWITITGEEQEYYRFEHDALESGDYEWRVKAVNNDDISTDYVYSHFTVIGITEAPVITSITSSAIPTISWEVESQDTFELEIYRATERLYASGIQKGRGVRSFTPNLMIPDGNYIIKMRCMNEFGYFTEWMTYSFVLITEKPEAVPCYIFANNTYGVTIARSLDENAEIIPHPSDSPTPDAIYVIRRVNGDTKWDIIGRLSTENASIKFDDNTVTKNVEYEYALRNYKEDAGYTDSESYLIMIRHKGVIIYDGDELVNITLSESEQFEINHTPGKNFSYSSMIGRAYPVRETSDWLTHNTSFDAFITFEQYKKLEKMYLSGHDLWFKGKDFSFLCGINKLTINAAQFDKGYDVSIDLSRVSEEEFSVI